MQFRMEKKCEKCNNPLKITNVGILYQQLAVWTGPVVFIRVLHVFGGSF